MCQRACVCVCACLSSSHGVSIANVLAGGLDDGLAGLVERSVDAVIGSGVSRLDQCLQLFRHTGNQLVEFTTIILI